MKAAELIDAVQAILRPRLQDKGVRVERVNWQEDMELRVDPDLMEQALSGLLANAVDASPPGSTIRVIFEHSPGRFVIGIRDSGPGIPFTPVPGSLGPGPTTKRFGTGLGIPVAFKICQLHGWELKFEVMQAGGTEVKVIVPVDDFAARRRYEQ